MTNNTQKSIRKAPKQTPASKIILRALRYIFELTDVAVNLLLGTKYQPVLFCIVVF